MSSDIYNYRNNNIDFLRFLSVLFVVMIHTSCKDVLFAQNNILFIWANFFSSWCRCAVPLFILMSGYLTLNRNPITNLRTYYNKAFNKYVVPAFIWTIIAFIFDAVRSDLSITNYSIDFIDKIYNGKPYYHLWYMYMAIGLYFSYPFILLIKDYYGDKYFLKLGITLLIIAATLKSTTNIHWFYEFTKYLGYFILGYSIPNSSRLRLSSSSCLLLYIISCVLIFLGTNISYLYFDKSLLFYEYLNPLVILSAIGLFMYAINSNRQFKSYYWFTKYSFNIYLCHAFVLTIIDIAFYKILGPDSLGLLYIPLVFLLTTFVSLLILKLGADHLLSKLYKRLSLSKIKQS